MTWEIVVGLIALLGATISICTIVANNTRAVTELKCAVEGLKSAMTKNDDVVCKLSERVDDHDRRITIIETKGGG